MRGLWPTGGRMLALGALLLTGCPGPQLPPPIERAGKAHELLVPAKGAYAGAYIDFGEHEDSVSLEAIEDFEKLVGKKQAIVASSSYWGEGTFPSDNVNIIARTGAVPLIFWSPWDRPYKENQGPDKFSLTSILAGEHDAYIDRWADAARDFGEPLLVSFANEPNGNWFPWSGYFYGGGKVAPNTELEPTRYVGPETYKRAYRYVVDRVRARGAQNVKWVLHLMNYPYPTDLWNQAEQYYPGPEYCDWLGMSVYGVQYAKDKWGPFVPLFDWPYRQLAQLDPQKPIMVVEWGVAEAKGGGDKSEWIRQAFDAMKDLKYARLKAIVFWHERWQNEDTSYSNLRVNSSPESLRAYREGIVDPYWIDRPIWKK